MSLIDALKQNISKRVVVIHYEGEKTHSIVGTVENVSSDIVTVCSDYNVRSWIRLDTILKVKEAK
ncbi:MAG: hypothetical protein WC974_01665 [Thermoplasmata archaeon]